MNAVKLLLLPLVLALGACGGPSFQSFDSTGDDAPAGAGGDVDPGTGGAAGSQAPGGSSGTAGAPSGGSAGSGATGSGGEPAGGAAGGGPTDPSCAPEEAIVFPDSYTWDGFSARWDDVDESYCASSTGGTCSLSRNLTQEFYTPLEQFTARFNLDCSFQLNAGICGAESPCAGGFDPRMQGNVSMRYVPAGDGWRLVRWTSDSTRVAYLDPPEACQVPTTHGSNVSFSNDIVLDMQGDLLDHIASLAFPCP